MSMTMDFSFKAAALSLGLIVGNSLVPACNRSSDDNKDLSVMNGVPDATTARQQWYQACFGMPTLTIQGVHISSAQRACPPPVKPAEHGAYLR